MAATTPGPTTYPGAATFPGNSGVVIPITAPAPVVIPITSAN